MWWQVTLKMAGKWNNCREFWHNWNLCFEANAFPCRLHKWDIGRERFWGLRLSNILAPFWIRSMNIIDCTYDTFRGHGDFVKQPGIEGFITNHRVWSRPWNYIARHCQFTEINPVEILVAPHHVRNVHDHCNVQTNNSVDNFYQAYSAFFICQYVILRSDVF